MKGEKNTGTRQTCQSSVPVQPQWCSLDAPNSITEYITLLKTSRNTMHRRAQRAEADLHIACQQRNKAQEELRIALADLETKEEGRQMVLKRFKESEEELARIGLALTQHHRQRNKAQEELRIALADLETKEEGRQMVLKRFKESEEELARIGLALTQHHRTVHSRMGLITPPYAATCSICGMKMGG